MPETLKTPEAPELISQETEQEPPFDPEEYERLLDMYDVSFRNLAEGEVVKGIVLQVTENEVIVDVGFKSEGLIPVEEFRGEDGKPTVKAGDTVDVLLERVDHTPLLRQRDFLNTLLQKSWVQDDALRGYDELETQFQEVMLSLQVVLNGS